VGHERFQEPADLGPEDRQRCRAVLLALPEIEHQAAIFSVFLRVAD
jgi:hypothetical protein